MPNEPVEDNRLDGAIATQTERRLAVVNGNGLSSMSWIPKLAWPAVVILTLLLYNGPLSGLINRIQNLEVSKDEKGSFKVAFIAANLSAAETKQSNSVVDPGKVSAAVLSATQVANNPALSQARILWVDDNPGNNIYERHALEALGITFDIATTTAEALNKLNQQTYSVIISDFKRSDDPRAGYTLLQDVKLLKNAPPFILYTASANPEYERDAVSKGAYAETNSPQRLFDLVVQAVLKKS